MVNFLLFSAIAGASAYGAYHYLKTKENSSCPGNTDDADDDFDDFSEDLDDEPESAKERSYVSLNLDKAEAIATEAFHKAKEVIVDSVNQVKETVKSVAESQSSSDANFTDLTALNKEKEAEGTTEEFLMMRKVLRKIRIPKHRTPRPQLPRRKMPLLPQSLKPTIT